MESRYWHELTTTDFHSSLVDGAIAVLPMGAIEAHGPHLPLYTDSCIADQISKRLLEAVRNGAEDTPADLRIFVLPTISVGFSLEHTSFPGTLTMEAENVIGQILAVGRCVHKAGVHKLLFFNCHGGNPPLIEVAALRLRQECGMLCVKVNVLQLPTGENANSDSEADSHECRFGIHGGEVETSLMLHLRPDLVRMQHAVDFQSRDAEAVKRGSTVSAEATVARYAWMSEDLNHNGVCGNAMRATAEKGARVVKAYLSTLMQVITDMYHKKPFQQAE